MDGGGGNGVTVPCPTSLQPPGSPSRVLGWGWLQEFQKALGMGEAWLEKRSERCWAQPAGPGARREFL